MSKRASTIPLHLRQGFHQAVEDYALWTPSVPEREIPVGFGLYSTTAICDLIQDEFTCPLPKDIVDRLFSYLGAPSYRDLAEKLSVSPNYATGAQCLRILIEREKAKGRRPREPRENR